MERKISAIIISLLLLSSIIIFVDNDHNVEAIGGEGEGDIDNIGLDYDFMWLVSKTVSNATYEAYPGDEITKGREFGSKGDWWTAEKIWGFMKYDCSLENVDQIPLGPIENENCSDRFYTSKINVTDYLLHIDNTDYYNDTKLPCDIPVNESFVFPQAYPKGWVGDLTFDSTMENVRVIEPYSKDWPAGGSLTNCYLNLTVSAANKYDLIMGNATFVADDDSLPEDQDGRVLVFDEEEGECEERLENVTNATGVVLIHDVVSRYKTPLATSCSFSVGRVNSNESNLPDVLDMLNDSEVMLVENILCNETLTFTYNIDCGYLNWPDFNFILIDELELPTPQGDLKYNYWLFPNTVFLRIINLIKDLCCKGVCKGVILFNNFTYGSTYNCTHFMNSNNPSLKQNGWFRFSMIINWTDVLELPDRLFFDWPFLRQYISEHYGFPGLPVYYVNYSVGSWLLDNASLCNNTVTGYVNQTYLKEIHGENSQAGVTAYNVIGNITTDSSSNVPDPSDPIILISNRYDGWWSEASFDSGCGVGLVLAIAKYFNDSNITPKVNITFLETTGEEYLFRGAQHFSDSNPGVNYSMWIGFDQLASNWSGSKLELTYNDDVVRNITKAICDETGYPKRTNNNYSLYHYMPLNFSGAEEDVWKQRNLTVKEGGINCSYPCKTICFCKGFNGTFGGNPFRHRRGENFSEGDLLKNIDQGDLNDTLELAWNITKYFCVDPDCWFQSYSETSLDSPIDEDTLNDTIEATFTVKSTLPHDLVMINATLKNSVGVVVNQSFLNFTVNRTGVQESINLTLPGYEPPGNYTVYLELYNSTGRINEILSIGDINFNDTEQSPGYTFLYPFGYPVISNVSWSPPWVGFGFDINISAYVISSNSVKVNITYPDASTENYTMSVIDPHNYQYVFNDTWQHGMYNFTIWAYSGSGGSSGSSGYSFNVSANASIDVATLKDNYTVNEFVNVTDPPNPLNDYYIVDRGLTWDKYYNASTGTNTLVVSQGPINYQDETSEWIPINCSLNTLEDDHTAYGYGYRFGNEQGLFNVFFKPNSQDNWPVIFAYNKSSNPENFVVRSNLVGVGYLDPTNNWNYEILQNTQSNQGQITGNSITYADVFTGTDVVWSYGNTGLKEEIIMSNTTKTLLQSHPPSDYGLSNQNSYLVFITRLDYSGLNMYNSTGTLNGNFTIFDGQIDFKDAFCEFKCALPLGEAYELFNNSVCNSLVYRVLQYNNNYYLLSGLKLVDLNDMGFPVVIDPTLTIESLNSDGYIYNSSSDYNTVWNATTGTISSSATYITVGQKKISGFPSNYYIYRGFLIFNTTELPDNAYVYNATVSLYKKDDASTTDFFLTLQNGQPDYPHNPLETSDYNKNNYSGNGGGFNTTSFVNGRNNITLTNYSWLTREGFTKFCLRSSRDIDGAAPSKDEYVNVYSSDALGVDYYPKLIISYGNQSKIKNIGLRPFKGFLLMQVHFYNETHMPPGWVVANDTINETTPRTISAMDQFGLDTVFNDLVNTSSLLGSCGRGLYRVYAALRDPDGNILVTSDDEELVCWYEFGIDL